MYELAIIIDDDPISILVCQTMLRKADFVKTIKTFKNPNDGLAFFEKHYQDGNTIPDFIFLDIQMPELTGWEFLDAYANLPQLPIKTPNVVMLSAVYDPEDQQKSADNELVLSFLAKPITTEALENLRALK